MLALPTYARARTFGTRLVSFTQTVGRAGCRHAHSSVLRQFCLRPRPYFFSMEGTVDTFALSQSCFALNYNSFPFGPQTD